MPLQRWEGTVENTWSSRHNTKGQKNDPVCQTLNPRYQAHEFKDAVKLSFCTFQLEHHHFVSWHHLPAPTVPWDMQHHYTYPPHPSTLLHTGAERWRPQQCQPQQMEKVDQHFECNYSSGWFNFSRLGFYCHSDPWSGAICLRCQICLKLSQLWEWEPLKVT